MALATATLPRSERRRSASSAGADAARSSSRPSTRESIRETKKLDEDTVTALEKVFDDVKFTFQGTGREGLEAGHEEFEELEADDITQAQIVKTR